MDIFAPLLKSVGEHLGAAQLRLVRHVLAVGKRVDRSKEVIVAARAEVVDALAAEEGKAVAEVALRQRIAQVNRALRDMAGDGQPLFVLSSAAPDLVITFAPGELDALERRPLVDRARESTRLDVAMADASLLEAPQVVSTTPWQVFVSHGWETADVEKKLDGFIDKLEHKLKNLPPRWVAKFGSIKLFFDRRRTDAISGFSPQTLGECDRSQVAVLLLSSKFHGSAKCQAELKRFWPDQKPVASKAICIQVTGKHDDQPEGWGDQPVLPSASPKFRNRKTLLELWSKGNQSEKDDFAEYVMDQICKALLAQYPDGLPPQPPQSTRPAPPRDEGARPSGLPPLIRPGHRFQARGDFDPTVVDGHALDPHVVSHEDQEKGEALMPILEAWARTEEPVARVFALLGSFGAGKTTAVQLFAQRLEEAYAKEPTGPFPVYLDFRRLLSAYGDRSGQPPNLAEVIRASLNEDVARDLDIDEMMRVLRHEPCVIIFDGLDEIGTRKGVEWATALYRQLLQVVPADAWRADRRRRGADWAVCPTRILITCRTQFFRDHMQEQITFAAHDRADTSPVRKGEARVETRYMAPFTPEQINSFFVKSLGEEGERLWARLSRVGDLANLAKKPIMTRYIAEIGQDLEVDLEAGRRINVATVYDHLFNRVILRDDGKKTRMTANDRRQMLRALALHLWQKAVLGLPIDDLEDWFDTFATKRSGLVAQYSKEDGRNLLLLELRNASLLMREDEKKFLFVHKSFYEYFLASALLDALLVGSFAALSVGAALSAETVSFVVDIIETDSSAVRAGEALAAVFQVGASVVLRQLAIAIMNEANKRGLGFRLPALADCSGLDLREMDLNAPFGGLADRIDFTNAQLNGARLTRQRFHACQFEGAILANAAFDTCSFEDCLGTPIGVASASALEGEVGFLKERGLVLGYAPGVGTVQPVVRCEPMEAVHAVAFSPDGAMLATGSDDGSARLFSVATGREVGRFEGLGRQVASIAFSPDGTTLATGSSDGIARLLSVVSGREVGRFEGHGVWVTSVAFSPDGEMLATGSDDGIARLFSIALAREVGRFEEHGKGVSSVAFSPDGATLATGSYDGFTCLFSVATVSEVGRFEGGQSPVISVAFSPDSATLATGSMDMIARLFSIETGRELRRFEGHGKWVTSVAFSPDGTTLATGSADTVARLFSVATGREVRRFEGHSYLVTGVAFSPDGATLATGSYDEIARLFSIATGAEVGRFNGHGAWVWTVAFTPNGEALAAGSNDGIVRLFSVATGRAGRRSVDSGNSVRSIAFSPDGLTFAIGSDDGSARLFSVATGGEVCRFEGLVDWSTSLAFSPDGATLATGSFENVARLFSVATGVEVARFEGNGNQVTSVAFSPDGATLATGADDGNARLFSVATGREVGRFEGHDRSVTSVAFSPDGSTLATGSNDGIARLFSVTTGQEVRRFEGHSHSVVSVAFSPDGTTLATGSVDGTARLFSVATGHEIARFAQHRNRVTSVAFSPDGTLLATSCEDGATRLFDVKSQRCIQTRYAIGDAWVMTDEDGHVIRMTRNAFPYIHGLLPQEQGPPLVVAPALPEIVDDV